MEGPSINTSALNAFRAALRPGTSSTHLPVALPLSFPSQTHQVNTLAVLHVVAAFMDRPEHSAYFAETESTPRDAAIRGVIGLYLSSAETWTPDNLLGTAGWGSGSLDMMKISDYFGITTVKEREHETMPGIRVGGRWDQGASLVEDLEKLFKDLAERLGDQTCLGAVVEGSLEVAWQEGEAQFARRFCQQAADFLPSLEDPYPAPAIPDVLPSIPLKLLQDLAQLQSEGGLDIRLPSPAELANSSPLPLPIALLLERGVLLRHGDGPSHANGGGEEVDKAVRLPLETILALMTKSVEVCLQLMETSTNQSPEHALSMRDIAIASDIMESHIIVVPH